MLVLILTVVICLTTVRSSSYIPTPWREICSENASDSTSPVAAYVNLSCSIPKSSRFHWKLNELRDWTIQNKINYKTTPRNRTVIYNISVTCSPGANISLPWPMRVPGLVELHVTYCRLVDRYKNINYTADVSDDMRVLEIRHSFWLGLQNNRRLKNLLNLTDDIECGQDSSLEVLITSNTSDVILNNADTQNVDTTKKIQSNVSGQTDETQSSSDFATSNNTIKPEDRLTTDLKTSVSDTSDLFDGEDFMTLLQQNLKIDPAKMKEAHTDFLKLINSLRNTRNRCNYTKLMLIDESSTPVTPEDHFDLMTEGALFQKLKVMNYSSIGLKNLPEKLRGWRINFPSLKYLDLSRNYIAKIQVRNLVPVENVGTVTFNVRHNNITFISADILNSWAAVDEFYVDIRDNPIHCGCELVPFIIYLSENPIFVDRLQPYQYVRDLQCYTPQALAGKRLRELRKDDLPCPRYDSDNTTIIVLGVFMAVLVLVILVIIRFKVEIRILLYTRLHVRLPCDVDAQKSNKMFDAFVSYSNEDADWVFENIVKFLEKSASRSSTHHTGARLNSITDISKGHLSFRLCIHQRDFIPGKTIFDNIVDSIEASRHTIIVLSPSFMRSHWAMEELRQAYRQSLVEKTRHLIVILLEKVSKEEMDPLISRCCKTFTYLEVSDSLFKDRLVFSLTTKDRSAQRRDRLIAKKDKNRKTSNQTEIVLDVSNQAFSQPSTQPSTRDNQTFGQPSTRDNQTFSHPSACDNQAFSQTSTRDNQSFSHPSACDNQAFSQTSTRDNQAFSQPSTRPSETLRELSNMSTSSTSPLTSDC